MAQCRVAKRGLGRFSRRIGTEPLFKRVLLDNLVGDLGERAGGEGGGGPGAVMRD